ncbi:hypothetical protein BD770DRAFT_469441 [Pilaira anomala]|nr:hypothetical protein BD770DRAFT_469441 [Pilaira anomala]
MTIIYTETYLTQDPLYNFEDNSAIFEVALSELRIICHIHRQENITYLRQNEVRSGDLIKIQGTFITTRSIDGSKTTTTFIKVHTIHLVSSKDVVNTCKKRKLAELNFKKPVISRSTLYQEVGLDFSQFYFLLSGQAYIIIENYNHNRPGDNNKIIQTKIPLLGEFLKQLYCFYNYYSLNGMNQLDVVNFVNTVTSFIKTLHQIVDSYQGDDLLPANMYLSKKIPLPSNIYHAYLNE